MMANLWWLASKLSVVRTSEVSGPSCTSSVVCLSSFLLSSCRPTTFPSLSSLILLTRAASPASCVPMKLVASTLA
eukprot:766915-Hanusia_phi.AAC.4